MRKKRADIEDMDFKSLMALSLKVMQDWRVIAIAVFVIFYISLANYVVHYKKKPPKVRRARPVAPAPAPAPAAEGEQAESSAEGGE